MSRSRATVLEELFKFLLVIISKKGTRGLYIYIYAPTFLFEKRQSHTYTTVLPISSLKKRSFLLLEAQTERVLS